MENGEQTETRAPTYRRKMQTITSLRDYVAICASHWKSCLLSCLSFSLLIKEDEHCGGRSLLFFKYFLQNNAGWYLRSVDFCLFSQKKARPFQVVKRAGINLLHPTLLLLDCYRQINRIYIKYILTWKRNQKKQKSIAIAYSSPFLLKELSFFPYHRKSVG